MIDVEQIPLSFKDKLLGRTRTQVDEDLGGWLSDEDEEIRMKF